MRFLQQPGPAIAHVKIPRHRKEPRSQSRIGTQPAGMRDQPQPGFLEKVLGDVSAPGEPDQKAEEPRVECGMYRVERGLISRAQAADDLQFEIPVHTVVTLSDAKRDICHGPVFPALYPIAASTEGQKMQLLQMLGQAGIVALLSLVVGVVPMVMGVMYAIRPSEARLALMRPLALASIFGSLCGFLSGLVNMFHNLGVSPTPSFTGHLSLGLSEALVPLFVGSGCLTVAWLCVALGLRRHA